MNIFKRIKSFFSGLFKKKDKSENNKDDAKGENMGYGFYPTIPNNQVGVEINNGTIRIIQNRTSNYSMRIEGMGSLNLVNSKVIKHYSNMPSPPNYPRDPLRVIRECIDNVNSNIDRFNRLSNALYFWDFSIFNDNNFWSNRNNFSFYPNGSPDFHNANSKSNGYNHSLPTITFKIGIHLGQRGFGEVYAAFNSSGVAVKHGFHIGDPQVADTIFNVMAIGGYVMFQMMRSLQVVQVYNDTTKPPYGLKVVSVYGEIYYPNSASKLTNDGDYIIVPRHSNIDFNAKTVNGINYSNKKVCFSDNVSNTIFVSL